MMGTPVRGQGFPCVEKVTAAETVAQGSLDKRERKISFRCVFKANTDFFHNINSMITKPRLTLSNVYTTEK